MSASKITSLRRLISLARAFGGPWSLAHAHAHSPSGVEGAVRRRRQRRHSRPAVLRFRTACQPVIENLEGRDLFSTSNSPI